MRLRSRPYRTPCVIAERPRPTRSRFDASRYPARLAPLVLLLLLPTPGAGQARVDPLAGAGPRGEEADLPVVSPNDNRTAAGELRDGVLTLAIQARRGLLHPQGPDGPGFEVEAFGETGGSLQAPGPIIRVPTGTEVRLTLENRLDRPMTVSGLYDRGGPPPDPIELAPGESRQITYRATMPGTYFYYGRTTEAPPPPGRVGIFEDQLSGAIVVDPPGAPTDDRVLMITLWVNRDDVDAELEHVRHSFLVNGLSWPYTERLDAVVGDSMRMRVINASVASHPMHLHGFYYEVEARGDLQLDTVYAAEQRRLAVTENMARNTTLRLSWLPKREGHWLFHCHFIAHISPEQHVMEAAHIAHGEDGSYPEGESRQHETLHEHAYQGMAGLMTGILVRDPEGKGLREDPSVERRKLRVYANARDRYFGEHPAFGYILQEGPDAPAADSVRIPGTPIVLTRDEPVEVAVVNRTPVPITVHWHGIELDSYYDGIAGWSGAGNRLTPAIAPQDSFIVRFTPDRAGTFIYHTHMEESAQLSSGLYAPLIVLEPGETYDPKTDHVLLMGWGGPGEEAPPFLNGSAQPEPIELASGRAHLLRFINITPSNNQVVRLLRGEDVVEWRRHGKDGARVPEQQATTVPSEQYLGAGETYDFELMAETPEELTLEVTTFMRGDPPVVMRVPVIIR